MKILYRIKKIYKNKNPFHKGFIYYKSRHNLLGKEMNAMQNLEKWFSQPLQIKI